MLQNRNNEIKQESKIELDQREFIQGCSGAHEGCSGAHEDFKWWFVGYSEGDDSLFRSKDNGLEVWGTLADEQILKYMQSTLGYGKVIYPGHRQDMAIYTVTKSEDMKKLEEVFKGRMSVSKVNTKFNEIFKTDSQLKTPTLDNAYISGLIDAEGSFWIKQEKKSNTFKFIFELSHKDKNILEKIKRLFSFSEKGNNIYTDGSSWKICFYGAKERGELIAYLTKYPLRSQTKELYAKWKAGLSIKQSNNPRKTQMIQEMKEEINKWRK